MPRVLLSSYFSGSGHALCCCCLLLRDTWLQVLTAAPDAVVTYEQALHDERIGPALRAALHEPTVARFSAEDRGVFVVTAYLAYAAFFHPDKPLGGWQSMLSRTTSLLPPRLGDAETALLTVCTHCRYHYSRLVGDGGWHAEFPAP